MAKKLDEYVSGHFDGDIGHGDMLDYHFKDDDYLSVKTVPGNGGIWGHVIKSSLQLSPGTKVKINGAGTYSQGKPVRIQAYNNHGPHGHAMQSIVHGIVANGKRLQVHESINSNIMKNKLEEAPGQFKGEIENAESLTYKFEGGKYLSVKVKPGNGGIWGMVIQSSIGLQPETKIRLRGDGVYNQGKPVEITKFGESGPEGEPIQFKVASVAANGKSLEVHESKTKNKMKNNMKEIKSILESIEKLVDDSADWKEVDAKIEDSFGKVTGEKAEHKKMDYDPAFKKVGEAKPKKMETEPAMKKVSKGEGKGGATGVENEGKPKEMTLEARKANAARKIAEAIQLLTGKKVVLSDK